MRSKTRFTVMSVLLLIAIAVSACAPASASTQAPAAANVPAAATSAPAAQPAMVDWSKTKSAADGGGLDALVAAAKAEGELSVITLPRDWCDYGDMMDNFSKKYGIKVNSLNPDGGSADEIQAIIDNKANKGPQAPDVIDVGPAFGPLAKGQNLLAPYKVATWSTIQGTNDPDGFYYVDYSGVMVFEINSDVVKALPHTYKDLLDPKLLASSTVPSGDQLTAARAAVKDQWDSVVGLDIKPSK